MSQRACQQRERRSQENFQADISRRRGPETKSGDTTHSVRQSDYQKQCDYQTDSDNQRHGRLNGRSKQRHRGKCGKIDCDQQRNHADGRLQLWQLHCGRITTTGITGTMARIHEGRPARVVLGVTTRNN